MVEQTVGAPERPDRWERLERLAPWAAGLLLALPVLLVRYPPMNDLPLHEGMVAVLRHLGDPAWFPPDLYVLNLGRANQLFEWLALLLSFPLGTALACKTVVAGTLLATIVGASRVAAWLGASRWVALAVAPTALGWTFYWGFVGNALGLAIFLWTLPALDRAAERATWRSALAATGILVLLGFAHGTSMLCGCGALLVFSLVRGADRRTALRLAPVAAAAALLAAELWVQQDRLTPLTRFFASRTLWTPLADKLAAVPAGISGPVGTLPEWLLTLLLLGLLVGLVVVRCRGSSSAPSPGAGPLRARLLRHRVALVAAGLGLAYLVLPYSLNFGAFLHLRFLGPAVALALLAAAPPRRATPKALCAVAAAVPLATLLAAAPQFAEAQAQHEAIDVLLPRIEMRSAVAVLRFGSSPERFAFDVAGAGNRVLAERGGRLLFSFAEYPIAVAQVREAWRWDATLDRVYWDARAFVPAWDFARIGYVLAHVADERTAAIVARGMAPHGELVAAEGEWLLFKARRPPAPLTTPDAPLPVAGP